MPAVKAVKTTAATPQKPYSKPTAPIQTSPTSQSTSSAGSSTPESDDDSTDQPLHTKYSDEHADLVLYSSDDEPFMIYKYELQYISPIFRAMLTEPAGEKDDHGRAVIRLVDAEFENSESVDHFIEWMRSSSSGVDGLRVATWTDTFAVFRFSKKYECQHIITKILTAVRFRAAKHGWHWTIAYNVAFAIASLSGDDDACADLIAASCYRRAITDGRAATTSVGVGDKSPLSPAYVSYEALCLVPSSYIWALYTAFSMPVTATMPSEKGRDIAVTFARQLATAKKIDRGKASSEMK